MRALNIKILILLVTFVFSTAACLSATPAGGSIFQKRSHAASDTSELNRHIRNALDFESKSKDLNILKANIDTAELICVEKNIEFPSSLNLARATYFFLTNDFRNAQQEATMAMKKSKSKGEVEILAKTMNFLGNYSLRTKFFMESISYFENAISIAEKNKLKDIIKKTLHRKLLK